jgi:NDP-sugar pyrophosphorylase family protein
MIRGMLVAAGFGTRLAPLTNELPKPAVPIANRPVAAFALEALARAGIHDVVVNTHHLASELERELTPYCPPELELRYVHEPRILGTGGGVQSAWSSRGGPSEGEDFVVMNAKLVFAPDISRALAFHRDSGAIATMVLRALPQGTTFAAVEHDEGGRIRRIRGLPSAGAGHELSRAMFTGVQILSERAFYDLPHDGDVIDGAYLRWLERGDHVQGVLDESPWLDVGVTVEHYLSANLALARREIVWPGIEPDAAGNIIDPSVRVPLSAQLDHVVLGRGAIVPEGAELARVVAWSGAKAPVQLSDAVVTSAGMIARV